MAAIDGLSLADEHVELGYSLDVLQEVLVCTVLARGHLATIALVGRGMSALLAHILLEVLLVVQIAELIVDRFKEVVERRSVDVCVVKYVPDMHSQGRPVPLKLEAREHSHFFQPKHAASSESLRELTQFLLLLFFFCMFGPGLRTLFRHRLSV